MTPYLQTQLAVYRHLLARHQQDPNFRFSVRKKSLAANGIFTGKENNDNFNFTLWAIPNEGVPIEAITYVIGGSTAPFFLTLLVKVRATPQTPQEHTNRELLTEVPAQLPAFTFDHNQSESEYHWPVPITSEQALLTALDQLITQTAPAVDLAIAAIQQRAPGWRANRITAAEFETMQKRLQIQKKELLDNSGGGNSGAGDQTPNHYWLNFDPSIWAPSKFPVGTTQTYTSHNANGNPRQKQVYFGQVQPGDLVIGYEATPVKRVRSVLRITDALRDDVDGNGVIEFEIVEHLPRQPTWEQLKQEATFKTTEPLKNNNLGSLFKLTAAGYELVLRLGRAETVRTSATPALYTAQQAAAEIFLSEGKLEVLRQALATKKNLVLQGPPGVGKTYVARRLAYLLFGQQDPDRVKLVQFHQSYAYEDFIRGWRPGGAEGALELVDGVFLDFVERARLDPARPYVFIIDEINRGNLSKIFGELLMLLEADKRTTSYALSLTYPRPGEPDFYLPPNVHLIGTMNTADRSLALVDYALRRRFRFFDLTPAPHPMLAAYLYANNAIPTTTAEALLARIDTLNDAIRADKQLGAGFLIGHSYFCPPPKTPVEVIADPNGWFREIIEHEIVPLLREYWYDHEATATSWHQKLLQDLPAVTVS